jgi:hypothetical protein
MFKLIGAIAAFGLVYGFAVYNTKDVPTAEPVDNVVAGKSTGAGRSSLMSPEK